MNTAEVIILEVCACLLFALVLFLKEILFERRQKDDTKP
jgi:hypothetical protein